MYSLTVTDSFDAAHHLRGYQGPCQRQHGHRFLVKVTVQSDKLDNLGMVVDFKSIRNILKNRVIGKLDHQDLNEITPFGIYNPTAENIAAWIYNQLNEGPDPLFGLYSVRVYESPDCFAEYMP